MKIASKISLSFLIVGLTLTITAASFFYMVSRQNLRKSIYNNLSATVASRSNHIETYLKMLEISVVQLSKSVAFEDLLEIINIAGKESIGYSKFFGEGMTRLRRIKEANPTIYELLLLDGTGKVIASSNESSVGVDKSRDAIFLDGKKGVYIKDVYYSEDYKEPLIAVSAPLLNNDTGEFLGVFAARVRLNELNDIVTEKTGIGESGEIYIVNKQGFMVTPSRFKEDAVLKQKVDTENVRVARLHKGRAYVLPQDKSAAVFPDYRGMQVLGTHGYIPQMQWAVLAEIGAKEAFAPLVKQRLNFFITLFIVPIAAWLLGIFVAGLITGPLHMLQKGTEIIGKGNLDYKMSINTGDEVGQLSRAFDTMTKNLKETTTSIDSLNKEIIERKKVEDDLKEQALELDAALEESLKSREIMTSMLDDNNKIREELEKGLERLKAAQAQLVHAEKMEAVGRMASGVAHEVKNPLGIILQGINYFEGELPPEEKDNREMLQMMKESVKRADKIVRALLDFSRVEELKIEQQDINTIIESSIDLVLHKLKLNSIEYVCELGKDLPKMLIDRGKTEQVFVNLFNNAVDAMPKGGKLSVRSYLSELKAPGNRVGNRENDIFRLGEEAIIVEVEDTGAGIDEDIMYKIFDPFFTTKNRTEGTGLGLSVAKSIIDMHKGLIDVESKKGKGTKFTIVFKIPGGGRG